MTITFYTASKYNLIVSMNTDMDVFVGDPKLHTTNSFTLFMLNLNE